MPFQRSHYALVLLACLLLSACAGTAASTAATTAPAATPVAATAAATATTQPTVLATATPAATTTRVATATPMPTPTAAPEVISAIYLCAPGLCRYRLGDSKPEQLITAADTGLYSYAFTPDGAGMLLTSDLAPSGDTAILLTDRDLGNTRKITTVQGAPSGAGELEGFGAIGMTADGQRVLFEDQAQLFIAAIDGSMRHALLEQRLYGGSSTHSYISAPSGLQVLYRSSSNPNAVEIINSETEQDQIFTLSRDRTALALIDDTHLLVERFEPPVDPAGSNPAAAPQYSLGYEIVPIAGDTLGQPSVLRTDDGSFGSSAISNIAGDWLLMSDDYARDDSAAIDQADHLWLLNLTTGARQPVSLPLYTSHSRVALRIAP